MSKKFSGKCLANLSFGRVHNNIWGFIENGYESKC